MTLLRATATVIALFVGLGLSKPVRASTQFASEVEHTYPAGVDLYVYRMAGDGVVVLRGGLLAGESFSPSGKPAVATLVAEMLSEGTKEHSQFEVAQQLEGVGATISFTAGAHFVTIEARCLRSDLPLVLRLLEEQLRSPAFLADRLITVKGRLNARLRMASDHPDVLAHEVFSRSIYPASHPNRVVSKAELLEGASRASVEDLRRLHAAQYAPKKLMLVIVGDLEPAGVQAQVGQIFERWSKHAAIVQQAEPVMPRSKENGRIVGKMLAAPMLGKTSVSVLLGQRTGLRRRDPDALSLDVGTAILGGGFTGRLMDAVRVRQGLTYGIRAQLRNDLFADGDFSVYASFAPELLERGVVAVRTELLRWWRDGVTVMELEDRKTNLVGTYQVSLASPAGVADMILTTVQAGHPLRWLDEYPTAVQRLSAERVNRVLRKYLEPSKMTLVTAGALSK